MYVRMQSKSKVSCKNGVLCYPRILRWLHLQLCGTRTAGWKSSIQIKSFLHGKWEISHCFFHMTLQERENKWLKQAIDYTWISYNKAGDPSILLIEESCEHHWKIMAFPNLARTRRSWMPPSGGICVFVAILSYSCSWYHHLIELKRNRRSILNIEIFTILSRGFELYKVILNMFGCIPHANL